jgi:beta-glucosidase
METGGPMLMPWASKVSGIVEAWYAGSRGANAVANVLFGKVDPSAKLPITFPLNGTELPPPGIVVPPLQSTEAYAWKKAHEAVAAGAPPAQTYRNVYANGFAPFPVDYNKAALLVGYKWYDAQKLPVLFPFGHGLSYTTFAYSKLKVTPGQSVAVHFTVKNTGKRAGAEVAEVYAALPASADEPPKRLVGWSKVMLQPGESKRMAITVQSEYLSIFNEAKNNWELVPGEYTFYVGGSSQDLPLQQTFHLK